MRVVLVLGAGMQQQQAPPQITHRLHTPRMLLARAPLLPTVMNVSTVHLQCGDVLNFIAVQQWVAANLGLQLQLLEGIFVTVERLRQVVRVEEPGALESADQAKVVLTGGCVVPAGRLGQEPLTDIEDNEDLCRELAALQLAGAAPSLRLYDLAHTVWRLRLCAELENSINVCNQEQADLAAEGYDDEMLQTTAQQACNRMRDRVHMLPKPAYVSEDGFFSPTAVTHLELDDHGFFDDPLLAELTGSPAPHASSVTRVLPPQGSLGFGMGIGALRGTGQGENPCQRVFGGPGRERLHPAAARDVTGYGTNSLERRSSGLSGGGEYGQPAAEAAQALRGRTGWQSHEAGRYWSGEPNRDRRDGSGDEQRRVCSSAWQAAAGPTQSRSGDSGGAGAASGRAVSASRDLQSPRHSRGRGGESAVGGIEGRLGVGRDDRGPQGDRAAGVLKSAGSSGNWDERVKEGKRHRTESSTWDPHYQEHPGENEDDHHRRKGALSNKRQRSSRARDRSRSKDRERDRDRDKSQKRRSRSLSSSSSDSLHADRAARKKQRSNRSRSPQPGRGAKAMTTDAADAGAAPDLRGPAVLSCSALDTVRRRFAGRLEGADKIFGSLSTEAIVLEWLRAFKQLRDSRHGQRHFTDGMCQLWYLRQELPIPQEAIEAYGSVFAFLDSCSAVVFNKFRKLVGLRDEVDEESFSLPAAAPAADESWQNLSERRGRNEMASEMDSGPGNEARNGSAAAGGAAGSLSSLAAQHSGPGRGSRDDHDSVQDDWEPDSRSRSSRHRSPGHPDAVLGALADAPRHYLEHSHAESLLPAKLHSCVKRGAPVDLAKFVSDHIPQLEVVPYNGRLVVQEVPWREQRQKAIRRCAYWNPSKWAGCNKAAHCGFRHDLSVPGAL
eukprot:gene8684-8865_t